MPNRFCAICGKNIDNNAPHYGMCLQCYLKEHPLFKVPEKYSLRICLECGSYSKKDEWIKSDYNNLFDVIKDATFNFILRPYLKKDYIKFSITIDENSFIYSSRDILKTLNLIIRGFLKNDKNISHEQVIKLNINFNLCKNCVNLRGGSHYLSIIQLRVKDKSQFFLIKEVFNKIEAFVEDKFEKDNRQYISKIEEQKYGIDLYLSTNEIMNYIISFLKKKYHFLIIRTKKLVGRDHQRGKNIYRLKTLIKLLHVKKGDLIIIKNKKYSIESITKNKIILKEENGAKLIKDYAFFFDNEYTIINKEEII